MSYENVAALVRERDLARALVSRLASATILCWPGWDDPHHDPVAAAEIAVRVAGERRARVDELDAALRRRNKLYGKASATIGFLRAELNTIRGHLDDLMFDLPDDAVVSAMVAEFRLGYDDLNQTNSEYCDAMHKAQVGEAEARTELQRANDLVAELRKHVETLAKRPTQRDLDKARADAGQGERCGEQAAHGGPCDQPVENGFCPDHGEVGPARPRKSCPECSAQPWRPHRDDCAAMLHEQDMRELAEVIER